MHRAKDGDAARRRRPRSGRGSPHKRSRRVYVPAPSVHMITARTPTTVGDSSAEAEADGDGQLARVRDYLRWKQAMDMVLYSSPRHPRPGWHWLVAPRTNPEWVPHPPPALLANLRRDRAECESLFLDGVERPLHQCPLPPSWEHSRARRGKVYRLAHGWRCSVWTNTYAPAALSDRNGQPTPHVVHRRATWWTVKRRDPGVESRAFNYHGPQDLDERAGGEELLRAIVRLQEDPPPFDPAKLFIT